MSGKSGPRRRTATAARTVAILALPGVQLLDVSGPLDVFAEANAQAGTNAYRSMVIATRRGPIRSSSGVRLLADAVPDAVSGRSIHTLLVAGRPGPGPQPVDATVLEWLRNTTRLTRRYGSVCSGALILAEAGILDGRRVTTHWGVAEQLARNYPAVTVEPDAIFIRDGRLRTAAGVTAGLDLALSLVEEDLGRDIALQVAAQLVMFFRRPGGQLQFSRKGTAAPAGRSALQEVQRWVAANPALDHSVGALARRMGMSTRHFARMFRHEVGTTPAAWIERARIAHARELLESGGLAPKQAASASGFTDVDTFRRAFVRVVGVTPAEYKKRNTETQPALRR
jgi:transcriptional regulator GlxA family with amidase domain